MAIMWVITYTPGLSPESEEGYAKEYQVLKEKFIKKAGSKNPYLENFQSEESLVSYVEYGNFIKKKIRVIKDKEGSDINSLDKKYQNKNNAFYEAMVLGDNSSIEDIEGYDSYVSQYRKDLDPIKAESLHKLSKLSEKELLKNSDFYSVASKGKIYLDSEKLKQLKAYQKKYEKNLNSFDGEELESLKEEMKMENELFFTLMSRGKIKVKKTYLENKAAAKLEKSFSRTLIKGANKIKKARKDELVENSFGGSFGKLIEPVTKLAGFDWRVNLAFISTFAAKENFVAVINGIFGISVNADGVLVGAPWTKLNGICMMIALALFPPCIPTLTLIKTETGKVGWMLFVTIYPIILGFMISILVFQLGTLLGFA